MSDNILTLVKDREAEDAELAESLEKVWGPDPVLPGRAPVKVAEIPADGPPLEKAKGVVNTILDRLQRKGAKAPDDAAAFAIGAELGGVIGWLDRLKLAGLLYPSLKDHSLIRKFGEGVKHGAKTPRDLRAETYLSAMKAGGSMIFLETGSGKTKEPTTITMEELEAACGEGARAAEEQSEMLGRLVLTETGSARQYYVWNEYKKNYTGPHARAVLRKVLERDCPTLSIFWDVEKMCATGEQKNTVLYSSSGSLRDADAVFQLCGETIDRVEYVAGLDKISFLKASRTLRVGVAQFRTDLDPARCEAVEEWLALIGGDQIEKLLDWLATFRKVTRPTCALYVEGVSSAGKELLARGLSRLYVSRQYCRYEEMVDSFNDLLLDSSLVYADEKMPDQGMKRGAPSAVFRSLTATDSFTINAKHAAKVSVRMCPRILITANDAKALNLIAEGLEQDSVEAIAKRILHVCPKDRLVGARDYLKTLGGRKETEKWVEGDLLARHVLWLEQTRTVEHGDRFIVEGGGESVTRLIVGREMDRVLEALAVYCSRYSAPQATGVFAAMNRPTRCAGIIPGKGVVFVKASALSDIWQDLLPREKASPSSYEIGRMLVTLAGKRGKASTPEGRLDGYNVSGDLVLKCAEQLGIGDAGEMKVLLEEGPEALKKLSVRTHPQPEVVDDLLN